MPTAHASAAGLRALQALLGAPDRRLAVIGASKNAGKTTVLNALTQLAGDAGQVAGLCSIGLDGEAVDAWLDFPKPPVLVERGTLVVTAAPLVQALPGLLQWLADVPGVVSALGPAVVARARTQGGVELCGIPHRAALVAAQQALLHAGANRLLVDGAYHRQAAAHPAVADAVLVAVGAVLAQTPQLAAERALPTLLALSTPAFATIQSTGQIYLVPGAVTDARLEALPLQPGDVVQALDPSRILCSLAGHLRLRDRQVQLAVRNPVPLLAVTTNPRRPGGQDDDPQELQDAVGMALTRVGLRLPLLDVVGGNQRLEE